ncbi:uncharacterized protein LOC130053621 [Ostrea edulis]|uniref:uncharacterized protein LOC130053621 n=1 Tax=Ostrea edulis TaxID=37623 RepID=UPI0024AFF011|nr:uncharacterized protein LOC130053621 [Ostrea edulis]
MIKIEVFDLRLFSDNGSCTQMIILDDGNRHINLTCNNNIHFLKGFFFETNTSCLNLTLSNASADGYFWFKFTVAEIHGFLHIECPPISCTNPITPKPTTEATSKMLTSNTTTAPSATTTNTHIAKGNTPIPQKDEKLTYILVGICLPFCLLSLLFVMCCLWKKQPVCITMFRKKTKSRVHPLNGDRRLIRNEEGHSIHDDNEHMSSPVIVTEERHETQCDSEHMSSSKILNEVGHAKQRDAKHKRCPESLHEEGEERGDIERLSRIQHANEQGRAACLDIEQKLLTKILNEKKSLTQVGIGYTSCSDTSIVEGHATHDSREQRPR